MSCQDKRGSWIEPYAEPTIAALFAFARIPCTVFSGTAGSFIGVGAIFIDISLKII
jgi:hypothetical protein